MLTVTTTIAIFTLKIFDVVIVMTGGQYGTEVVAHRVLPAVLHQPQLRLWRGHRHRAVHRRAAGDDL